MWYAVTLAGMCAGARGVAQGSVRCDAQLRAISAGGRRAWRVKAHIKLAVDGDRSLGSAASLLRAHAVKMDTRYSLCMSSEPPA